jgi:NitT/TauT family transport system permease protein
VRWLDALVLVGLGGIVFGIVAMARVARGAASAIEIDLSPWALPLDASSRSRADHGHVFSLSFTLVYGYWAAKDRIAGRVLIPLLDVLQSVPCSGSCGPVLGLVAVFPHSNTGLELAAVLMIFTGQAWNMTFLLSLAAVGPRRPRRGGHDVPLREGERLRRLEAPLRRDRARLEQHDGMAGGWFFLMINEAFVLGDKDFRLPGLGSYMSVAAAQGDTRAMAGAVLAMSVMIVALDQLLWRPIVVWAQKFRVDESGQSEAMHSWFLDLLRRSELWPGSGAAAGARPDRSPRPGRAVRGRPFPLASRRPFSSRSSR